MKYWKIIAKQLAAAGWFRGNGRNRNVPAKPGYALTLLRRRKSLHLFLTDRSSMKQSLGTLLGVGVLAVFAFSSCSKPPKEISGQVFIHTRGRQSIKLGLVEVRLYDLRIVENWLKEVAPRVASYQERAEELVKDTKNIAMTASTYSKFLLDNFRVENQDLIRTAANRADKATELERAAEAYLQVAQSGIPYFTELPKEAAALTKTDADGRFSFDVPRKSQATYAVIAKMGG
jgi:hypothetical protein